MIGLLALSLTTPYCPMSALFICQEVAFGRLKTKENFKLLALKVVVVTYSAHVHERWLLTRGSKYSDLT